MYKQYKDYDGTINQFAIIRTLDNVCIPFAPDNTDYQNFKKQINADEAQLEDAEGNLMTAAQAKAFIKELP